MGLYNFQERFVPFILSGAKTHTIRATRKYPDKLGNTLHLYTGLRVKGKTRLLMRAPCVKVETILIRSLEPSMFDVFIDGNELNLDELERLAKRDGFSGWADMAAFWKGRLPFTGHVIHWR